MWERINKELKWVPEKLKYNSKISVNRFEDKVKEIIQTVEQKDRVLIYQNCLNAYYVPGSVLSFWNISICHYQQQQTDKNLLSSCSLHFGRQYENEEN